LINEKHILYREIKHYETYKKFHYSTKYYVNVCNVNKMNVRLLIFIEQGM